MLDVSYWGLDDLKQSKKIRVDFIIRLGSSNITRENVVDAGGDLGQSVEVAAVAHCLCEEKNFNSKKKKMLAFELIKKQRNRYLRPKHQGKNYTLLKIFHNHD